MFECIRGWLEKPGDPDAPERSLWDWLLVALVAVLHVGTAGDSRLVVIALIAMVSFVLPWRRSHPLLSSMAYAGALCIAFSLNLGAEDVEGGLTGIFIIYALARWASGRHAACGFFVLMATSTLYHVFCEPNLDVVWKVVETGLWVFLPAAVGLTMRYRAEGRRLLVEDTRLNERVDRARELHDTVAHHVSAIAIQARNRVELVIWAYETGRM